MILEKIERPSIAKEGSSPNISWGIGSIPSNYYYYKLFKATDNHKVNNNYPLLAYS